jgi:class 3 adenylate cyclase/pimeloyl-ACP methyl ester carboxylesterase
MEIADWLRRLGLDQYEHAFRENDIDAETLPGLTADDLRELGVTSLGHRKKLLSAIATLSAKPDNGDHAPSPLEISTSLTAMKTARAERRHLTVMFADLVGSTALAVRLDPEDMREILAAYHQTVAAAVTRFEGYIARFMGDGVLVYFGWPQAHEDDAERGVRAGLAIVEAVERLERAGGALSARVGISTGLVVVGDLIVEGAAQEEDVVGVTPNLAARLEQCAEPGAVLISESTRRLLGGWFEITDLGPQRFRGIEAPVRAFRVVGEATPEGRFEALRSADVAPLIGREHELALLLDRWEIAKSGEGQVVVLSGEAGIGKSRIVLALRERLRNEPHYRIGFYCSPHHMNSALWPVVAQLQRTAGHLREDAPSLKLEKLERLLGQAGEFRDDAAPLLAELMGLPLNGSYATLGGTPQEKKARLFGILLTRMERLSRQLPMLAVLEDAHWLDPTSAELFERVVDRIRTLPILLVATWRPDEQTPWTNFSHVTLLSLNRLGSLASRKLIQMAAGERSLPPVVTETILSRTEGVPLFVEELTKAVLEAAIWTTTGDGALELASPLPPLAIPATLEDSLMARLDRLAPAREVAQIAACIGREFDEDVVRAVATCPETKLAAALGQLCRAGLIQRRGMPPRHEYSFKHALVRDAAYATLLKSSRQQLHARIAQAIERLRPEIAASQPEIVAHHFIEGGLPDQGATYLLAAGRLAKARHAAKEAVSQLETCLQLTARHPGDSTPIERRTERECLLMLGDLAGVADDLDRANNYYERAMALGETEADRDRARNCIHRARYAERDGARLVFYEHGSGAPAIVFINPIVYGLASFQPILEQLCQEFRVITVDCRGAGRSDPLVRPYSTLNHMEDLRAIIHAADAAPIVGVGISRGSNLLIQLAHKHPQLVGKIMTVGTPLVGPTGRPILNPDYMKVSEAAVSEMALNAYGREAVEQLAHLHNRYVYSEPDSDELRRMAGERVCRLPIETILSFYDPDPALDIAPLLESISIPTLATHGGEDQIVPRTGSELIAARIPGAQLYIFEGKGHNPMFSATNEFCEVLRNFIRARTPRVSLAG